MDIPPPWFGVPLTTAPDDALMEQELRQKYGRMQDPYASPLPGSPWLHDKINSLIEEKILDPAVQKGHPDLGAAMATVPATFADFLLPQTYGDVTPMGVIGKGPGKVIDLAARKAEMEAAGKLETKSPWLGLKGEGEVKDLGEAATSLHAKADQALHSFWDEMAAKYGEDFQTKLTPEEKATNKALSEKRLKLGDRLNEEQFGRSLEMSRQQAHNSRVAERAGYDSKLEEMKQGLIDRDGPEDFGLQKGHKEIPFDRFDQEVVPKGTMITLENRGGDFETIQGVLQDDFHVDDKGLIQVKIKGSDGKTYKVNTWDADIWLQVPTVKPVKE